MCVGRGSQWGPRGGHGEVGPLTESPDASVTVHILQVKYPASSSRVDRGLLG